MVLLKPSQQDFLSHIYVEVHFCIARRTASMLSLNEHTCRRRHSCFHFSRLWTCLPSMSSSHKPTPAMHVSPTARVTNHSKPNHKYSTCEPTEPQSPLPSVNRKLHSEEPIFWNFLYYMPDAPVTMGGREQFIWLFAWLCISLLL